MGKMLCKVCGYVGGPGEAECPECGAPLRPAEAADAATSVPAEEVYITTKPQAKPKEKKPLSPRRAHVYLAAGFLAVCLLVQGLGLWRTAGSKPTDWSLVCYGELVTPRGIVPLEDGAGLMGSMFGPTLGAGLGPRRLLWGAGNFVEGQSDGRPITYTYYYDGKTVRKTQWTGAVLSGDNQVLFYLTDLPEGGQALFRRDERTLRAEELDRGEQLVVTATDAAGDALAYLKQTGEDAQPLIWRRGSPAPEAAEGVVYHLAQAGPGYLAMNYDLTGEDPGGWPAWDLMVAWDEEGGRRYLTGGFLVDQNVTEVLYQDDEGVWCYENAAGEQARLGKLPKGRSLWQVRRGEERFQYFSQQPALTDRVYTGNDGALYCLSEDLTVTNLSGSAAVQTAALSTDADILFYLATEPGEAGSALYRVEDPLSPDRETVRELAEDDVKAFDVSPDGAAVLAKVRPGKTQGPTVYKLSVDGGPWQTVEMEAPANNDYTIDGVQLMNGGGCWYFGDASSLHKTLCYRSPSGEITTKLAWTSPVSSTFYPAEPGAVTLTGIVMEMDMELIAVSGDQALVRVSSGEKAKYIEHDPPITSEARYWLLDKDGSMEELKRLEVS